MIEEIQNIMKYTPIYKEENTLKTGMEYHWEHEGFKLIILDFYLSDDRFVQVTSNSRYVDLVAVEDPQDSTEVIQRFKVDINTPFIEDSINKSDINHSSSLRCAKDINHAVEAAQYFTDVLRDFVS